MWVVIEGLKRFASAGGPGTSIDAAFGRANNLAELAARTCFSRETLWSGLQALPTVHWPALLGTGVHPLATFSIESTVTQGFARSSWLPLAVIMLAVAGVVRALVARSATAAKPQAPRFAMYLVLVGLLSPAGYVVGRCGVVSLYSMRYELLSPLAIVGLTAWFFSVRPARALLTAWTVVYVAWLLVIVVPHVRLAAEYVQHRPVPAKEQLIDALRARRIHCGTDDYWLAYYIDFMTNERMIFASVAPQRILVYNDIVAAHAAEAVRLSRRPCEDGVALVPGVYQCP